MIRQTKKILKWLFLIVFLLLIAVNIYILASGRTYIYKAIACTYLVGQPGPGILDKNYFHSRTIEKNSPEPWGTHELYGKILLSEEQENALRKYQTTSFLIIEGENIVLEKYWEDMDPSIPTNSFSMAKSIVSILIGIAIDEGKIKNEDQKVGDYIPEFREGKKSELTLKHLLTMSAALNWTESGGNPLSHNAEGYYGWDLMDMIRHSEVVGEPGKIFNYQSGATLILSYCLEKATGMNISEYASEKLWKRTGAESDSYWSLDDEEGMEKSFCCFYATTRDFARFGKLYMNNGKWNGRQIVSEEWVRKSITPADLLDEDGKTKLNRYGYSWWMMDYKDHHVFYMRGILGQYVLCIPDLEMIIVRTGHQRGEKDNSDTPSDIYLYLDIAYQIKDKL